MKRLVFYYPLIIVGGVETAIYNLISKIYHMYDITVCFIDDSSDFGMLLKMSKYSTVVKLKEDIECDICIFCSIFDNKDSVKIKANKYYQWIHGCVIELGHKYKIRPNIDKYISVSEQAQLEFKEQTGIDSILIHNELNADIKSLADEPIELQRYGLNLVTISRISAEKGFKRMYTMAKSLKDKKIDFTWYIVGEGYNKAYQKDVIKMFIDIPECIFVGKKYNPYPYIKNSDYLVQLSDSEAFCFSILESLELSKPVICTSFKSAIEQITDGYNGYIFKFDLSDFNIDKVLRIPQFRGSYQNDLYKWLEIL